MIQTLHTRWRRAYSIVLAALLGGGLAALPIVFPNALSLRLEAGLSDPLTRMLPPPPPPPGRFM